MNYNLGRNSPDRNPHKPPKALPASVQKSVPAASHAKRVRFRQTTTLRRRFSLWRFS